MKKGPILISLLVVLVIIGFAYFRLILSSSGIKPVYDAIPQSAAIIFEFKNFNQTKTKLNGALYAKDLQQAGFVSNIIFQLDKINEYFYINEYKPLQGNKILATLHLTELKEYDYLYLIEAKNLDRNDFKAMILAVDEKMKVKFRTFKEEAIYDVTTNTDETFFTVAKINGVLMLSRNASLVEEAMIQIKEKKSLLEQEDFQKVKSLAGGDSDVLMLMNFKNLVALESLLTDASKTNLIKNLSMFSEWMESDIMLEQKSIIINGYTLFSDPKKSWIAQLAGKPADNLTLQSVIPDETALFMLVSNASPEKYFTELKDHIQQAEKLKYISYFKEWSGDEWAFGMNEPLDKNWQNQVFLVVKNNDTLLAENKLTALKKLIDNDSTLNTYKKGRLNFGSTLNDIYGKYLLPLENPYYSVENGYTFFANDSNTLNTVIENVLNEQTFSKNVEYLNFSKNISASSNLYFYINSNKLSELFQATLSDVLLPHLKNKTYQKFSPASVQFSYEENLFFTSAYINYKTDVEEKYKQLWKLQLDTPAATQAYFVTEHNTNEKEIVVQDEKNQLYQISKAGNINWKVSLANKIISQIYQVDFYNNGRLQYVFNTTNEIHVIDREGKHLPGFPLRLPDVATNGMLLAHYKDVNQYRIFIACSNRIYGYELSGKALNGWNPKNNVGDITQPMQHYVTDGKDFLIAINNTGKIFLFDRKGDNRTEPIQLKEAPTENIQVNNKEKDFEIIAVGKTGTIYKADNKGNVKELKFGDNPVYNSFIYTDINADSFSEYVFIDGNKLVAYNDSFNIALELNLPVATDSKAFGFKQKGKYLFGMTGTEANRTLIVEADGSVFDEFIIYGITPFEINSFNTSLKNIIVTCDKNGNLTAYKLP